MFCFFYNRDVSYTDQNGLQLDMEPVLGPDTDKEIIIEKNDNAEGIIEFTDSLLEGNHFRT